MKNRESESTEEQPIKLRKKLLSSKLGNITMSVALGLGGVQAAYNGYIMHSNNAESEYPQLDEMASSSASEALGKSVVLKCKDMNEDKLVTLQNKLHGVKDVDVQGYVATYSLGLGPASIKHPTDTIHLNTEMCEDLTERSTNQPSKDYVDALLVVEHERQHVEGMFDEATANCTAAQSVPKALAHNGYSMNYLRSMAPHVQEQFLNNVPKKYKSEECRVGQSMHLNPTDETTGVWLPAPLESQMMAQN